MKKHIMLLAVVLISTASVAQGNGYNAARNITFTATGNDIALQQNSLILYHELIWTPNASVATCSVRVDSSVDGITWTSGGIITSQTCTTAGNTGVPSTSVQANYIRITLSTLTGAGASVNFQYEGWAYAPGGGGGGSGCTPSGTSDGILYNSGGGGCAASATTINSAGTITLANNQSVTDGGSDSLVFSSNTAYIFAGSGGLTFQDSLGGGFYTSAGSLATETVSMSDGNNNGITLAGASTPIPGIAITISSSETGAYLLVSDPKGSSWGGTGGSQGAGTINAVGLYVNGTSVLTTNSSVAFNKITTGSNTSATMTLTSGSSMVVDGSASITTTGSGTINATALNGNTFQSPGAIGGTTPAAGTFTALKANTSFVLNGSSTLTSVQGTDIALLSAGTVSGTGANLCTDANGGATTTGCTSGGSGTVTSFSAGSLSPLFTTSVATSTTTPALSFSLTNAGGGTVFGNNGSSSAAPSYTIAPVLGIGGTSTGTLILKYSGASGSGLELAEGSTPSITTLGASESLNINPAANLNLESNGTSILQLTGTYMSLVLAGSTSTPSFVTTSSTSEGFYSKSSSFPFVFTNATINEFAFGATASSAIRIGDTSCLTWSSSSDATGSLSTAVGSASSGLVTVGTTCGGTGGTVETGTVEATSSFSANGTAGVSAGPFTAVSSITSTEGIVTSLSGTSDARLKENIEPYQRGLDAVMQLHPATYEWNAAGRAITNFPEGLRQAGFIAQDVQQAIPEAIGSETEKDGSVYLTFSDRPVTAALVNAVQEQQREIADLKQQIASLKAAQH